MRRFSTTCKLGDKSLCFGKQRQPQTSRDIEQLSATARHDPGLCCRAPAYCLRVNSLRATAAGLADELGTLGVSVARSSLLPEDFLCVEAGLATFLRSRALAEGLCQVGSA